MGLLDDGLILLVIGMGTVFAFLGVMVICTVLMAKVTAPFAHLLAEKSQPARRRPQSPAGRGPAGGPSGAAGNDLMAVIAAAVHRYRAEH